MLPVKLASDIGILEALGYSVLGLAIVFAALILLMAIIKIQSAVMNRGKEEKKAIPAAPAAPAVEAAPIQTLKAVAPGSAGEVKLYDVPDKTAAMLMAIVAETLKMPLNELRFKSIKEVK